MPRTRALSCAGPQPPGFPLRWLYSLVLSLHRVASAGCCWLSASRMDRRCRTAILQDRQQMHSNCVAPGAQIDHDLIVRTCTHLPQRKMNGQQARLEHSVQRLHGQACQTLMGHSSVWPRHVGVRTYCMSSSMLMPTLINTGLGPAQPETQCVRLTSPISALV
jgi:hypothetical protein